MRIQLRLRALQLSGAASRFMLVLPKLAHGGARNYSVGEMHNYADIEEQRAMGRYELLEADLSGYSVAY